MLKRLTANIVLNSGFVVNSYNFEEHLPVGRLKHTLQRLQEFLIDEVIILNTSHSTNACRDFADLLSDLDSWHIATPLAYGGGIVRTSDAIQIIKTGADRVIISPRTLMNYIEFESMCDSLGDQAIILHMPLEFKFGEVRIHGHSELKPKRIIDSIPKNWGGEILISFVENDGAISPNWQNISTVLGLFIQSNNLILAGGFSTSGDIETGLELTEVTAISVGNILHRRELSVRYLKRDIRDGIKLRRAK